MYARLLPAVHGGPGQLEHINSRLHDMIPVSKNDSLPSDSFST